MKIRVFTAFFLFIMGVSAAFAGDVCSEVVFYIEKSTNSNVVVYEAKMDSEGLLVDKPLDMYWLKEGKDERASLGWLEKKLAYGVKYLKEIAGMHYEFCLAAVPDKVVVLSMQDGCPVAKTDIQEEDAVLNKVYVELTGISNVKYIELTGTNTKTNQIVSERIYN